MSDMFNAFRYLMTNDVGAGSGAHAAGRGSRPPTCGRLEQVTARVAADFGGLGTRRDDRAMPVTVDDVPLLPGIPS